MNCDTMSLKNPTNQFEWQVKDFHETKEKYFVVNATNADTKKKIDTGA